jgi:hypothetical protein
MLVFQVVFPSQQSGQQKNALVAIATMKDVSDQVIVNRISRQWQYVKVAHQFSIQQGSFASSGHSLGDERHWCHFQRCAQNEAQVSPAQVARQQPVKSVRQSFTKEDDVRFDETLTLTLLVASFAFRRFPLFDD